MRKATVAIEDHRFYEHGGVDYEGIARAAWKDLRAGQVVQGGSTITQQLVRNLYISKERTLKRKLKEACLAIKLSRARSKDWILGQYMNQVYYGNHAYGIEAAAQTYFSKHARDLTLVAGGAARRPAAGAVGLRPAAPARRGPIARRDEVLARDARLRRHHARRSTSTRSQQANLQLKPGRLYTRIREPYFFSYVRDQLIDEYGAEHRPLGRPARLHDDQPAPAGGGAQGDHATRSTCATTRRPRSSRSTRRTARSAR